MEKITSIFFMLISIILSISCVSAAHYIVGEAYDALDSTTANGKAITFWNPAVGISDNITDIIGQTGNSGIDNVYFADCEMLSSPCQIGDIVSARVFDSGEGYSSKIVNVTITDAGFDIMPNLTIALEISFLNVSVDDLYQIEIKEIDLIPADKVEVFCEGIIYGPEMDSTIESISSELFSNTSSFYKDSNQNNKHYTNDSCSFNTEYGDLEQTYFNCSYNLEYYSMPGNWTCIVNATKSSMTKTTFASTNVNSLLALELPDTINYGTAAPFLVSSEKVSTVSNAGNIAMNISLTAYAQSPGDNLSMYCPDGTVNNISLDYQRYNVTGTNPGSINFTDFQMKYNSLSSDIVIKEFNLNSRQNDIINDATKPIYWRIYLPEGLTGSCSGNIIFGAVNAPET